MDKKHIFLDIDFKDQKEAFAFIVRKCIALQIIDQNNGKALFDALIAREKISSTGFENGFAIPHARIAAIKTPTIFYVRLKNGIDWKSIDAKPTKYLILLLVPENAGAQHLEMLSQTATSLLNQDFCQTLANSLNLDEIIKAFELNHDQKVNNESIEVAGRKNILAITACSVGIAHTYLAAEKIAEAAEKLNYNIKVETHGSIGVKNEFSLTEIETADLVIIASDIGVDQSRFIGKKVFNAPVKKAITNGSDLIMDALKNASVFHQQATSNVSTKFGNEKKSYFIKHLLSGVSYMIPFIIFGGLMLALSLGLSQIIYGKNTAGDQITGPPEFSPLWYLSQAGIVAFQLMIPILAGFIANSVAGRSAIAPAAIVAMISNTPILIYIFPGLDIDATASTPLGFLGGIFYGFLVGYSVKWINTWRIHKNITAIMPIFVIPLAVTLFFALLAIFVINAPISYIMLKIGELLSSVFTNNATVNIGARIAIGIGMGALFGGMIGFDMGGPVNKIAFVTASSLLTLPEPISEPMGMVAASVAIAPLGMGVATFVYKKHFDKEQRTLGISALAMGSIGISEGAIPFAVSDPKRVILTNVIGSAVAGAIAGGLGVTGHVPHGGPIVGVLGAISGSSIFFGDNPAVLLGTGISFFFLAIAIGVAVHVALFGVFLKTIKYEKTVKNTNQKTWQARIHWNFFMKSISQQQWLKISQYSMMVLGYVFTLIGIVMWTVYGADLTAIIQSYKENAGYEFDSVGIIYATFTLIFGLLLALASFMHWFTFKPKVSPLTKNLN